MISLSNAFKTAMQNGEPQRPLIEFTEDHVIFTADDINVQSGIHFTENFNTDTDLTMGGCPSSTLSFVLFNDGRKLNSFGFGKCRASIGVRVSHSVTDREHDIGLTYDTNKWIEYKNGNINVNGTTVKPSIVPVTMVLDNTTLYIADKDGKCVSYTLSGNSLSNAQNITLTKHMVEKVKAWGRRKKCFYHNDNVVVDTASKKIERYEYCPLGVFIAEKPNVMNNDSVSIRCNDQMVLLDKECEGFTVKNKTLGSIVSQICTAVGVTCSTADFPNKGWTVQKEPSEIKTATYRDVLSWVAEVACSYARFNRQGVLELGWYRTFGDDSRTFTMRDYETYSQYWYDTHPIDKLVVRSSNTSAADTVLGTGENGYIIENNPLIGGGA